MRKLFGILLGCGVLAVGLAACETAVEDGTAPSGSESSSHTGTSKGTKYSGEPSDRVPLYRDGRPWPYATTREQIEKSEWRSRSFYPPEYCWVVHSEYWNTPQYWDIRRWCDKREMSDDYL